jgi:2-C-methyl-D-erythritol 4-phosphate cytidylyltransferase
MTTTHPSRCYALVPCAGVGSRAGTIGPKQYMRLAGTTVVGHTLAALAKVPRLQNVMVVLSAGDDEFEWQVPGFPGWVSRAGGASRAQTVANGLAELQQHGAAPDDWVLVHDAARCLVQPQWIDALIDACIEDSVGGLLALPVADTLKDERQGRVAATVDRANKWQAQTPQMFRIGMLRTALERAGVQVTDEASAIESLGLQPKLVRGSLENFKVTYANDFDLAERLLRSRA